ncbi:unnamed protein product [Ectocarpus sp. CCAP 1310/34]|nr:unnamed protein product [Ectocarpus sp. CCAP 1310/34]
MVSRDPGSRTGSGRKRRKRRTLGQRRHAVFEGRMSDEEDSEQQKETNNNIRSAESERLPKLNVRSWSLEASGQLNSGV